MSSKLVSAEGSSKVFFPSESVPQVTQKDSIKSFVIALLLLVVAFVVFVATMLAHYPQKVDAFLNSDQPVQSRHVVTSSKKVP
jgi:quinol-cytochrome oxidoreductase complex cytochrome b subunit